MTSNLGAIRRLTAHSLERRRWSAKANGKLGSTAAARSKHGLSVSLVTACLVVAACNRSASAPESVSTAAEAKQNTVVTAPPQAEPAQGKESAKCEGYYSYIPADKGSEGAFSVQVKGASVEVLSTDFDNLSARSQLTVSGISFSDGGQLWQMVCSGEQAFVTIPAGRGSPEKTYRLTRTDGDIWSVAKQRGWNIVDGE